VCALLQHSPLESGLPPGARSRRPRTPAVGSTGSQQRIRNIYGLDFLDPELLLADVRTLLLEEAGPTGKSCGDATVRWRT